MDGQLTEEEQIEHIRVTMGYELSGDKYDKMITSWRINAGKSTAAPYHRMYATLKAVIVSEIAMCRKAVTTRVGQDLIAGRELIANLQDLLDEVNKTLGQIEKKGAPGAGKLTSSQPSQRMTPRKS